MEERRREEEGERGREREREERREKEGKGRRGKEGRGREEGIRKGRGKGETDEDSRKEERKGGWWEGKLKLYAMLKITFIKVQHCEHWKQIMRT